MVLINLEIADGALFLTNLNGWDEGYKLSDSELFPLDRDERTVRDSQWEWVSFVRVKLLIAFIYSVILIFGVYVRHYRIIQFFPPHSPSCMYFFLLLVLV